MTERYSHRNGETEPPTIAGHYGHLGVDETRGGIVQIEMDGDKPQWVLNCYDSYSVDIDDLLGGQWWGPITGPWDAGEAE